VGRLWVTSLVLVAAVLSSIIAGKLSFGAPGSAPLALDPPANLIINEIDYDQPGADVAEFIELKNVSSTTVDLEHFLLELVDGAGGGAVVYHTVDLPDTGLAPGDHYVVCADAATVPDCDLEAPISIQNGAPDAVALVQDGVLVDTVSYEGDTAAPYTEGSGSGLADLGVTGNEYTSLSRFPDGTDTGANNLDFSLRCITPGSTNSADTVPCPPPFGTCDGPATLIHDIQGNGAASPMAGSQGIIIQGIVVGDFQDAASELGGFFVQEEDTDADMTPESSEGVFVHDDGVDVNVGDLVRVQGDVAEVSGLTELMNISNVAICSGSATVDAAHVALPVDAVVDLERYEGMLVTFPQALYATGTYDLGQYGEVWVSANGRQFSPTQVAAPGTPAQVLQDLNDRSRLLVDDGSMVQNPASVPYLAADNTLRLGDTVENLTGVLSHGSRHYRLQPTIPPVFDRVNTRLATPDDVGGTLTVASFSLLNYFNGDGQGGGFPTTRGAHTLDEFNRQRDKIASAVVALDADVLGLVEIENDGYDQDSAISDLVSGLNAATFPATYAFIDPGVAQIGPDEITVGFIYRPGTVASIGSAAILDSSVDPLFNDDKNRPALAQTFEQRATGERFTVAVSHLKSKDSPCDDVGDPDMGDGQGNCNVTRTEAATALAGWLATDPTGSNDPDLLIIGGLNAYSQEDPIIELGNAGYIDLIDTFVGENAYSYVHSGQAGCIDHALANESLRPQVVGATIWHINADEPRALDYNDDRLDPGEAIGSINPAYLYSPDAYRSSDHDPVLVYLGLASPKPELSVTKTVEPTTGVPLQGTVTYTIRVANSGDHTVRDVMMTDVLPPEVDFVGWIRSPANTTVQDGVIAWHGDVGAGETLAWVLSAKAARYNDSPVVNTAAVEYGGGLLVARDEFSFELKPVTGIVITEIMQNPQAVGDSAGEWLELYNASSTPVDLAGCTLGDNGTDSHLIDNDGPLAVQPGEYLIFGRNADPARNGGVNVAYAYASFLLGNDEDEVVLECNGREVDRVDYDGGTTFPDPNGASMQLLDPALDNNLGGSWCQAMTAWPGSAGDRGTPGAANDCLVSQILSITKTVATASEPARLGDPIAYTIVIANHGDADADDVHVTDLLPAGLIGDALDWRGTVQAGDQVTFTIPAIVTTSLTFSGRTITNTAFFNHASGSGYDQATFAIEGMSPSYLPLVCIDSPYKSTLPLYLPLVCINTP
jgi:uncharacterized repeat protein (TIGR01451 family)